MLRHSGEVSAALYLRYAATTRTFLALASLYHCVTKQDHLDAESHEKQTRKKAYGIMNCTPKVRQYDKL